MRRRRLRLTPGDIAIRLTLGIGGFLVVGWVALSILLAVVVMRGSR